MLWIQRQLPQFYFSTDVALLIRALVKKVFCISNFIIEFTHLLTSASTVGEQGASSSNRFFTSKVIIWKVYSFRRLAIVKQRNCKAHILLYLQKSTTKLKTTYFEKVKKLHLQWYFHVINVVNSINIFAEVYKLWSTQNPIFQLHATL